MSSYLNQLNKLDTIFKNGGKIYQFNDASIVEMIAKLKTNRSKGKLLMEM